MISIGVFSGVLIVAAALFGGVGFFIGGVLARRDAEAAYHEAREAIIEEANEEIERRTKMAYVEGITRSPFPAQTAPFDQYDAAAEAAIELREDGE